MYVSFVLEKRQELLRLISCRLRLAPSWDVYFFNIIFITYEGRGRRRNLTSFRLFLFDVICDVSRCFSCRWHIEANCVVSKRSHSVDTLSGLSGPRLRRCRRFLGCRPCCPTLKRAQVWGYPYTGHKQNQVALTKFGFICLIWSCERGSEKGGD